MYEVELSRIAIEPVSNGFIVTHTYFLINKEKGEREYRESKLAFVSHNEMIDWVRNQTEELK